MPPVAYKRGWVAEAPRGVLEEALASAEYEKPQDSETTASSGYTDNFETVPEVSWKLQGQQWVLAIPASSASEVVLDVSQEERWIGNTLDRARAAFGRRHQGGPELALASACDGAGGLADQGALFQEARLAGGECLLLRRQCLGCAQHCTLRRPKQLCAAAARREYLFVCWQLLQGCSLRGQPLPPHRRERLRLLKRLSPGWCGANACQIAWCFAFRPSLDTPQLLWISAVCLTGIAGFLSLAHRVLCEAKKERFRRPWRAVEVPLTLHFGWTTAAALVNWTLGSDAWEGSPLPWLFQTERRDPNFGFQQRNGYVSRCSLDLEWSGGVKVNALWLSLVLAGSLGTLLALRRKSGLYALTVAWAVVAVASHSSTSEELREEFPGGEEALKRVAQVEYFLGFSLIFVALFSVFQRQLKR
eukprot:s1157_g14.t1